MPEEQKVIVYIEDEPGMIDLAELILKRKGYRLVGAIGGQEGLETVRRLKPDLVLLDLMMPEVDGWDVYHHMKADEELKDTPVIIITARADPIDRILGEKIAKVQAYLIKPFGPQELLDSIDRVLGSEAKA